MTVNTTYSKTRRRCAHCSLLQWIISSATSTLTGLKMGIVRVELKCKSSALLEVVLILKSDNKMLPFVIKFS